MEKEKIGKPKTAIFVFKDFLESQGMSKRHIMKRAYQHHKDAGMIGKLAMAVLMESEPVALRLAFPESIFAEFGGNKFDSEFRVLYDLSRRGARRRDRIKAAAEWRELFFGMLKETDY
jgi:hypothetical protein